MKRRFYGREARRRLRYYRSEICWDIATAKNPDTGRIRAHETGKSMMYVATHPDTRREADRRARDMVAHDIALAAINDLRLKDLPQTWWAR